VEVNGSGKYTLAYYDTATSKAVKSFINDQNNVKLVRLLKLNVFSQYIMQSPVFALGV
jgi:hypothetical protein